MKTKVGIVGHRGYGGAELVRLLRKHSHVEPVLLEHRETAPAGPPIRRYKGPAELACDPEIVRAEKIAVVFLATPAEVSMELAPRMLGAGARVVDLSGAFRLRTPENYAAWYKAEHTEPALLAEAAYGLPEFCRKSIPGARLVANPGCYPTAANLAIRPLIEAGVVDRSAGIVCDAKSGVSGAGRKPSLKTSFCEVTGNFSAYSILTHRHVPEVLQTSGLEEREFCFTAQLLPLDRGILETVYFRAKAWRARTICSQSTKSGTPASRSSESTTPAMRRTSGRWPTPTSATWARCSIPRPDAPWSCPPLTTW
jgi:N-acetyl-gamma-glutamyl-phosphate reductase